MRFTSDILKSIFLTVSIVSGVVSIFSGGGNDFLKLASGGSDFSSIYLVLFFIIAGAVAGRYFARKLKQPEVLGELVIGVIIGAFLYQINLPEMVLLRHQGEVKSVEAGVFSNGDTWTTSIEKNLSADPKLEEKLSVILTDPSFPVYDFTVKSILLFSNLGVLVLLFLVGLESSIEEMLKVGGPSMTTAMIGVIVPSILGFAVSSFMLPDKSISLHLFMGAALSATSIGITARVFKDLNKLQIPESRIVLGAAVIDDVLGLILLAVVTGIVTLGAFELSSVLFIILKAVLFLGATLYIGSRFLRQQIKVVAILENRNTRLLFPFALLVLLAWISEAIGLSGIVGAFAAGLIIKEEYFRDALKEKEKSVKEVIEPVEAIFAPVFFVLMGIQVDVTAFAKPEILGLAVVLTIVAIAGKLFSGVFAKGMDKKIIGIGMIPRGEVGLIFAGIGKSIGILDSSLFSSVIILVILTTLITPPALKWAFENYDRKNQR
jgi:Kef-type K+ transport system membrane component KefB